MIGATDARWMGIPFREFTICVFCRPLNGDKQEGIFLVQAFNSVRWFAWVERIEVEPVREVSLVGVADLVFWSERLAASDATPAFQ